MKPWYIYLRERNITATTKAPAGGVSSPLAPGNKLILLQVEKVVKDGAFFGQGDDKWKLHDLIASKVIE